MQSCHGLMTQLVHRGSTVYVLTALPRGPEYLTLMLLRRMEPYAHGYEDRILNAVWVGLLGLEVLMVLGVAVRAIAKRLSPAQAPKVRTQ
ncbi:hypothetical protein ACRE_037460 [Hapsidospora chrysogenum ATCC 11550]|uniref:Uncharacterized protein n=1 Tax=Hapsidospora chrysogenum (strain ATCC 11550 / CBS 779.69 / DSM 880 / IAM 14645 / JCM 23072 / IMI 49137) TaxID=857340 RepID=A0A086T7S4_HAPC1|nr:hypothetical protein ACRE_037460 [Hapsidospora chrysogenum ATCC 11550]